MNTNRIRYLRVSLLSGCNFHCSYCRPPDYRDTTRVSLTKPNKFKNAIDALHRIGIRKVRFTGGEPTLYKHLADLIAHTKSLTPEVVTAITTNGYLLKRRAQALAEAGLDSVNISLDTLRVARFRQLTGRDGVDRVLAGLDTAIQFFPSVKLNCVIMRDVNTDETGELIDFANERGIDIRFIEFMPSRHCGGRDQRYISGRELRQSLPYPLYPVDSDPTAAARYYSAKHLRMRVGFIEAVSRPFCHSCDRIRLTADGALYGCLFSGRNFNLFDNTSDDPPLLQKRIEQLLAARTGLGCSGAMTEHDFKPSFVVTGG